MAQRVLQDKVDFFFFSIHKRQKVSHIFPFPMNQHTVLGRSNREFYSLFFACVLFLSVLVVYGLFVYIIIAAIGCHFCECRCCFVHLAKQIHTRASKQVFPGGHVRHVGIVPRELAKERQFMPLAFWRGLR